MVQIHEKSIKTSFPHRKLKVAIAVAMLVSFSLLSHADVYATTNTVKETRQAPSSEVKVEGVIKDAAGETIIGATIKVKETGKGTISDIDGNFSIQAPANGTLVISYVGFNTIEEKINGRNFIDLVMKEDDKILDEVVVVGYGVQKKASITGSVAAIKSDELLDVKTPNVTNMLAGRLPGLRAAQRSGTPGDDAASVDIRGYGNMLVIVDGIERDYAQLDANDIESISILKDAAAAVYGFKGSNGVLLVTTKTGGKQKAKLEYNGYIGFQNVTRYPKMMGAYDYASLYNEAIMNVNPLNGIPAYTDEQLEMYRNGTLGTNWWDEMVKSASPQTSHNINIKGGSDKVTYYISGGLMSQEGILKSDDWNYKRYNVRSNLNIELTKGFNIDLKLAGRYDKRKQPDQAGELFRTAQMAVPTYSVYANNNPEYWQAMGDRPNPVHASYSNNAGYQNRSRREFNSSITFSWDIPWIDGLLAKAMIGYDYKNTEWKNWRKELAEYSFDAVNDEYIKKTIRDKASLESKIENYYKPTYQYSLNYNKTFATKHDVGAMLLFEMNNDKTTWLSGYKQYGIGLIPDLDYGDKTNQTTSGNTGETAHAGLVGRFNYAYSSKYLAELSFRYDGSYKFRRSDRWGFFPGVSLGWRISEEGFFKNQMPDIDNFKIRASYAKVGDEGDFSAYQYLSGYQYDGGYVMGSDGLNLGMSPRGMANPWLTWYESKIMNAGFEGSFKKGLISVEFDWFRRKRTGLPATRNGSLPTTFGESMPQENLNSDINTGFEFSLGHLHQLGDFKYSVSGNFSVVRIKNDYIERAASLNLYDNWRNNNNDRYKDVRWGKKAVGQFSSFEEILNAPIQDGNGNKSLLPGDLRFQDFNGDGIIDDNDVQPIGHGSTPRMYYGFNFGGEYKGFDLTVFFQGAAGHDIYLSGDILDPFIQQGLGNGLEIMTDRWHRENPQDPYSKWIEGTMPAARTTGFSDNRSDNSWSLHKADYLRLKTLEFGYTLPKTLTGKYSIDKVRVYMNCNNLLTFTSRKGLMKNVDPESDQNMLRYYPQVKTFNFGLNVTF